MLTQQSYLQKRARNLSLSESRCLDLPLESLIAVQFDNNMLVKLLLDRNETCQTNETTEIQVESVQGLEVE